MEPSKIHNKIQPMKNSLDIQYTFRKAKKEETFCDDSAKLTVIIEEDINDEVKVDNEEDIAFKQHEENNRILNDIKKNNSEIFNSLIQSNISYQDAENMVRRIIDLVLIYS